MDSTGDKTHEWEQSVNIMKLLWQLNSVLLLLAVSFPTVAIWKPKTLSKVINCVHHRGHVLCRRAEKGLHVESWVILPNTVAKNLLTLIFFCFWQLIFYSIWFVCLGSCQFLQELSLFERLVFLVYIFLLNIIYANTKHKN